MFEGPSGPPGGFGMAVSRAGDTNADGVEDLIVGHPADSINGSHSGSATVFSGTDGQILHMFVGKKPDDALGSSVANAGDVNGDGYDDVIVGAPLEFSSTGEVRGSTRAWTAHCSTSSRASPRRIASANRSLARGTSIRTASTTWSWGRPLRIRQEARREALTCSQGRQASCSTNSTEIRPRTGSGSR